MVNRELIRTWVGSRSPYLQQLYDGAVSSLGRKEPGWTRTVPHAVREVLNRLPDYIAGVTREQRFDCTKRVKEVGELLSTSGFNAMPAGTLTPVAPGTALQAEVLIKIVDLVRDNEGVPGTIKRRVRAALASVDKEKGGTGGPVVQVTNRWAELTQLASGAAHHVDALDVDQEPKILQIFADFELLLEGMARQPVQERLEIDEILEQANT